MLLDRFGQMNKFWKKSLGHPSLIALKVLWWTSLERPGDDPNQLPRDVP